MNISAEWLEGSEMSAPELRATASLLTISIAGRVISRLHDTRRSKVTEFIVMPAYPLAEGITRRWWQIVGGRGRDVRVRLFRDGFAVPDIVLAPDGRAVTIAVQPFDYANPPVRFLESAQERLPTAEVERDLRVFVETVLARLDERRVPDTALAERWEAITASYEDDDERAFCEAAGALGVDPYACGDTEARLIGDAAARFDGDALAEFLAAEHAVDIDADLHWLDAHADHVGPSSRLPDLAALGLEVRGDPVVAGPDAAAWQRGTTAARAVRARLGLGTEHRFEDGAEIARRLGNAAFAQSPDPARNLRAVRSVDEEGAAIVVALQRVPSSMAFALGRAVGDVVVFGEHGRAPVTDRYTYRQATGRAFAAELLAPAAAVVPMFREGWDVDELASHWRVSPKVIQHQIDNNAGLAA